MNVCFDTLLIVGCGGTGTNVIDILLNDITIIQKYKIKNIWLIDGDIVEKVNLEQQFLYKVKDIGHYKAETLYNIMIKNKQLIDVLQLNNSFSEPKTYIHFINKFIETRNDLEIILDSKNSNLLVLSCVDNIKCRRILASTMYTWENTLLVDIGSTGKQGSIRVYYKQLFPCFYCTEWMFSKEDNNSYVIPVCGINNIANEPNERILKEMYKLGLNKEMLIKDNTQQKVIIANKAFVSLQQIDEFLYKKEIISAVEAFNSCLITIAFLLIISGDIIIAPFFMINTSAYGLKIKPIFLNCKEECNCNTNQDSEYLYNVIDVDKYGELKLHIQDKYQDTNPSKEEMPIEWKSGILSQDDINEFNYIKQENNKNINNINYNALKWIIKNK